MGGGGASSSDALLPNKRFGKAQATDTLRGKSPYHGEDAGEPERGSTSLRCASRGVTQILWWLQPPVWTGCCPRSPLAVPIGHTSPPRIRTLAFCQTAAASRPVARLKLRHLRCQKRKSFSECAGKLQGPKARGLGVRDQNCGPQRSCQRTGTDWSSLSADVLSARIFPTKRVFHFRTLK